MSFDNGDYSPERKPGCASLIYSGFFRRSSRGFWPRRSTSTGALPTSTSMSGLKETSPTSKRRRGGSDEGAVLGSVEPEKPVGQHPMSFPKNPPYQYQEHVRKPYNNAAAKTPPAHAGGQQGRKKEVVSISGELDSMINDYQRSKGSSTLVRASSGNVMLYGNLGNLRKPGGAKSNHRDDILEYLPKTADEMRSSPYEKYNDSNANVVAASVARKASARESQAKEASVSVSGSGSGSGSLCRALSTRMDPEQLKMMGNEDFKEGRFAEALALYEAAIAIDPEKAAYRSNKSAALTALGQLLDAVFECREAIRIEPSYHRAHHRLGTLYLRLGDADKALYHYKQSGPDTDPNDAAKAQGLRKHLNKCTEARRVRDWNTLLKVTELAISSGADSAPQIYALRAEALLKLHRHLEADATLSKGPHFSVDDSIKFFGPVASAGHMVIRAQVDMAAGRFEEAVEAAQRGARLDSNNKEASALVRRTKGVAAARSRGNELFKASKFSEACNAYGEGLEHDPYNSVLLCNRAACQSKLGQYEKAIEDCNKALNVRPSYSKARLRRADCNAKLERWEASIEDYEVLIKETPEDEQVSRALSEVRAQLKKQRSESSKEMKPGGNAAAVQGKDPFKNVVNHPGTSVVLFCNKWCDKKETQIIEELSRQYPSVRFLKVDVDDNPHVAKSEEVDSLPTFRVYKNGSKVEDITETSKELLEDAIDSHCNR